MQVKTPKWKQYDSLVKGVVSKTVKGKHQLKKPGEVVDEILEDED